MLTADYVKKLVDLVALGARVIYQTKLKDEKGKSMHDSRNEISISSDASYA